MSGSPLYQAFLMALREAARLKSDSRGQNRELEVSIRLAPASYRNLLMEVGTEEFAAMTPGSWLIGIEPVADSKIEPGTVEVQTRMVFR
jgi:hypothetical protein